MKVKHQWVVYAGVFALGVMFAGKARQLPVVNKLPSF